MKKIPSKFYRVRVRVPPEYVTSWTTQYYPQYMVKGSWRNFERPPFEQDICYDNELEALEYITNHVKKRTDAARERIAELKGLLLQIKNDGKNVLTVIE